MIPKFPKEFLWGVAVSSFQAEMGRGEVADRSDWWAWVHDTENMRRGWVSGDVPEDGPGFWELYPDDLKLAKDLGCNTFRLSLDWARLFPVTTKEVNIRVERDQYGNISKININDTAIHALGKIVNTLAVNRYRDILSKCRELGLEPMVTLYHWPIPIWLHEPIECRDDIDNASKKGWLDENTLIEFAKYCAYSSYVFGDIVDLWATINEVKIISDHGFLDGGEFPPGINDFKHFMKAMRNLSMAHGLAYEQIKTWDRSKAGPMGESSVGVVAVLHYHEPGDPSSYDDVRVTMFNDYLFNEWSLNAVFRGDYDMNVDGVIEGDEQLPHLVKGCDWIGINYYLRRKVCYTSKGGNQHLDFTFLPPEDPSDIGFDTYPEGLRFVCDWAYNRYRRPIYITENGIADKDDTMRERYIVGHLTELQKAIELDGVPVKGYYHWSLIDNLEWSSGYSVMFGLYSVDKHTKKRIIKASASSYKKIIDYNRKMI